MHTFTCLLGMSAVSTSDHQPKLLTDADLPHKNNNITAHFSHTCTHVP
jgi:hypothetical protein